MLVCLIAAAASGCTSSSADGDPPATPALDGSSPDIAVGDAGIDVADAEGGADVALVDGPPDTAVADGGNDVAIAESGSDAPDAGADGDDAEASGDSGVDAALDAPVEADDADQGDADTTDAPDADGDALDGGGEPDACSIGTAQSVGTNQDPSLFGQIVYFDGGSALPAGRYRITYVDGCMKYAGTQDWTIHAYSDGSVAWWLGATSGDRLVMPSGTVGFWASNGAYSAFADCVAANLLLEPVEFDFAGGQLGLWVADTNYGDNVAGENGRNPTWKLERLGGCAP